MENIEQLLSGLSQMHPISQGFSEDLKKILSLSSKKDGKVLLKIGSSARHAWQLLENYLIALGPDHQNNEIVQKIYYPGMIVTDLYSFFEDVRSRFKLQAVGGLKLLQLKKKDFQRMYKYPETYKLIQHIMLSEQAIEATKAELLVLEPNLRVRKFMEIYPVPGLPDHYCASFLRMTENDYAAQKSLLAQSGITFQSLPGMDQKNSGKISIYAVRDYIQAHYCSQDIDNIQKIASLFYLTKKTMNRNFKKAFDQTVCGYITSLKMARARNLLLDKKSISDICREIGYTSTHNFSRNFKKYFGYSPNKVNQQTGSET